MIMSPATADDQYWACVRFYRIAVSPCGAGHLDVSAGRPPARRTENRLAYVSSLEIRHSGHYQLRSSESIERQAIDDSADRNAEM
jgi:hypothetical protein